MNIKTLTKEELERLPYDDIAFSLLKSYGKKMKIQTLFKKICDLLDYSESDYENKIGDYYTSLTLDKRFVLLDSHEWDLRERHAVALDVDDEEEEEIESEEEAEEDALEETEIDDVDADIDDDDDLDDMSIVDEDDEEKM